MLRRCKTSRVVPQSQVNRPHVLISRRHGIEATYTKLEVPGYGFCKNHNTCFGRGNAPTVLAPRRWVCFTSAFIIFFPMPRPCQMSIWEFITLGQAMTPGAHKLGCEAGNYKIRGRTSRWAWAEGGGSCNLGIMHCVHLEVWMYHHIADQRCKDAV